MMRLLTPIMLFSAISLARPYCSAPYDTLGLVLSQQGDDWRAYAAMALNIKHGTIPNKPYHGPGGILYSFFLAGCFAVFGERLTPVFILQHVMLGLSIALLYRAFERRLRYPLVFLWALVLFGAVDVCAIYSTRLLSENLALFTLACAFYCLSLERRRLAGLFMGLTILTRPNVLVPTIMASCFLGHGFVGTALLTAGLNSARNFVVCGKLNYLPTLISPAYFSRWDHPLPEGMRDYHEYILLHPAAFIGLYAKKFAFCLGFLPVLSAFPIMPHWILMWSGYVFYLATKARRGFEDWEKPLHLFIWGYLLTLMATTVQNYGFRMLLPVNFLILMFGAKALEFIPEHPACEPRPR